MVLLEERDRIPADGRLLEAHELHVDESALTGESLPVEKGTDPLPEDTDLARRSDMVFLATGSPAALRRGARAGPAPER